MSEPLSGASVPPTDLPTPSRRRRRPVWLTLLLVLVLIAGAGVTAALVIGGGDDKSDESPHPDKWAADVLPLVSVVEKERELEFDHPVYIDFLPDAEFRKQVTADEKDLTAEDRKDIEQTAGLMRAIGLLEGDVDLFSAMQGLMGSDVLGYYSFEDELIRVRGEKLTPATKATLVHELTHALQDQHFDLGKRYDDMEDSETNEESVFEAIVEGDASRVETAYRDTLSEDELAAVESEEDAQLKASEQETADLPKILSTMLGSTYTMGEAMIQLALVLDDNDAINELFKDPPVNDEQVFDPWTALADHEKAKPVKAPKLADGEKEIERGEFGSSMWFLMLSERMPEVDALDAADGWGNDKYVHFDRGGTSCVRIAYVGDTETDTDELEDALQRWIAVLPESTATAKVDGDVLTFESCDPGTKADVGNDTSDEAIALVASRTYLAASFIRDFDADETFARCYSDGLVHEFNLDELNDEELGSDPDSDARLSSVAEQCA